MKFLNKSIIIATTVAVILVFILHKLYFGYSPVGYVFNLYWYQTHKGFYKGLNIKNFPLMLWRVESLEGNDTIIFGSFLVDGELIRASFGPKKINSKEDIESLCDGNMKTKHLSIAGNLSGFLCENEKNEKLAPLLYVPFLDDKEFFIYNYHPEYWWLYKRLLAAIYTQNKR